MHLRSLILFIFILPLTISPFHAQEGQPIFEHLNSKHGLSSDNIESIAQDKQGFYWIATLNGFNRFDGTKFKVYYNKEGDSTSLSHNSCRVVKVDRKDNIWIGTFRGVSQFQKSTGHFKQLYFTYPAQPFEQSNNVFDIMPDGEDHLWVSGYGLWKYDPVKDSTTTFVYDPVTNPLFPAFTLVSNIERDSVHHGLWFSTDEGLLFYAEKEKTFYHKNNNPHHWKIFEGGQPLKITISHEGLIWFRHSETDALSYFDMDANTITFTGKIIPSHQGVRKSQFDDQGRLWILYYLAPTEIYNPSTAKSNTDFFSKKHERSISAETITCLFIDKYHHYWIGTPKGINIYKKENQYYHIYILDIPDERGPESESFFIRAFAQHESSSLWLSTNLGFYQYDLHQKSYRKELIANYQPVSRTMCFAGDLLWFNMGEQLWAYHIAEHKVTQQSTFTPGASFLQRGNDHDLWMGLRTSGLYRINEVTGSVLQQFRHEPGNPNTLSDDYVTSCLPDGEKLWIGYNLGKGFSSFTPSTQQWTHFQPTAHPDSRSGAVVIDAITKDDNGQLWLGTLGNGVFVCNPADSSFRRYTQEDGLSSNFINSILKDKSGNIWISTADGINYFRRGQNNFIALNIDLRFRSNLFTNNGISGKNGKLYFFSHDQFVEIDPDLFQSKNDFPDVVISDFSVFDKVIPRADQTAPIHLTYNENFFSFTYSAIKTHPDRKVQYTYKLDGFDKGWIHPDDLNQASYTNVPEGSYVFQLKATNEQGDRSDVLIRIPIQISPPFWRTWWFVSILLLALASGLYMLHAYRVNQLQKLVRIRSRISRDLHDEVGSSLSSIHVYSSVANKALDQNLDATKNALHHIHHNAQQVMENMSDIVWAIHTGQPGEITLEEKLKNYGYELLTPLNIKVTYTIDQEAEKKLKHIEARKHVLLIAKEAINNIARYSGATEASVQMIMQHKNLLLEIADNGKGFNPAMRRQGNGLLNMKHRTESMGGKLILNTAEGHGTVISCTIPIAKFSRTHSY